MTRTRPCHEKSGRQRSASRRVTLSKERIDNLQNELAAKEKEIASKT